MKIKTNKKEEVLDITEEIQGFVSEQEKEQGICNVFVSHTTCSITTADLDPGTDLDMLDFLHGIIPDMKFRHPHNPKHAPSHIISSIIGPSVSVPFENKTLMLGIWQRIVLVELDGPRDRNLTIKIT